MQAMVSRLPICGAVLLAIVAATPVSGADGPSPPPDTTNRTQLIAQAQSGAAAQYGLAYQSYAGRDYARALDLLRRPVLAGYAPAGLLLGYMYETGAGVKPDLAEARQWYETAAATGDPIGLFNVGVIAVRQRDNGAAATAFRAAGEKGYARAQAAYGQHLETGQGVETNEAEAVTWYRKAAEGGDAVGAYFYGTAIVKGMGGVVSDLAEAAKWYRAAADQNLAAAQNALGAFYAEGRGVPPDPVEAAAWFKKAADQGLPDGMNSYAGALDRGAGVARNVPAAITMYKRVAEYGLPSALHSLADHYFNGEGVQASATDAYYWATLAQRFYKPNDLKRDQLTELKTAIDKNVTMGERVSLDRRVFTFTPKPEPALPTALTIPPSASRSAPSRAVESRAEPARAVAPQVEPSPASSSQFPEVQIND